MSGTTRARRAARGGHALLAALVPTLVVCVLSAAFMRAAMLSTRRQQQSQDMRRAFYLAEAGLHEGMAGLFRGSTGIVGSAEAPVVFGEGFFWVEVEPLDDDLLQLESHARSHGGQATLAWVVQRIPFNFSEFGFFAVKDLKVKKGSLVDGYDSSVAPYDAEAAREARTGRLVSNEDVELEADAGRPTAVYGSVNHGLEHEVVAEDGVTLAGETASLLEQLVPPAVEFPVYPAAPKVKQKSPVPLVLPQASHHYEKITVEKGRELILRGPTSISVKELVLETGARLTFDTSAGEIELFVLDRLELEKKAQAVTLDGKTARVDLLLERGAHLEVKDDGVLHGLVYAPEGKVHADKRAELFGSVVARELKLDEGVKLHFDRAIGRQEHVAPRRLTWRIVDLSSGPVNPFLAAGLDPADLRSPSEAHVPTWLEIKYRPAPKAKEITWVGWNEDFDWGLVVELVCYRMYVDDTEKDELLHVHP